MYEMDCIIYGDKTKCKLINPKKLARKFEDENQCFKVERKLFYDFQKKTKFPTIQFNTSANVAAVCFFSVFVSIFFLCFRVHCTVRIPFPINSTLYSLRHIHIQSLVNHPGILLETVLLVSI